MFNYTTFIIFCWLGFALVWFVAAMGAKRTIPGTGWTRKFTYIRIALALALLLIFTHLPGNDHALQNFKYFTPLTQNPIILLLGAMLCVAGIAFAIWARIYLGTNWGMPMSHKENPELVTTGPYAYVRHPIYAGILLAAIGSIIAGSVLWAIPLVVYCAYFFYSAPVEEKIMTEQFPDSYPAYKRRTKMLIPFVF